MSIWQQLLHVARRVPSEMELQLHRWVMRQHLPDPNWTRDGLPYCPSRAHRVAVTWPCEDFLQADRAVDAVLERR